MRVLRQVVAEMPTVCESHIEPNGSTAITAAGSAPREPAIACNASLQRLICLTRTQSSHNVIQRSHLSGIKDVIRRPEMD